MLNPEIINTIGALPFPDFLHHLGGLILATTTFQAAQGFLIRKPAEIYPPQPIEWNQFEATVPTGATVTLELMDRQEHPKGNLVIADYREREGVKPKTLLKWAKRDRDRLVHKRPFHILYHSADFAQFFTVVDHQSNTPMGFIQRK